MGAKTLGGGIVILPTCLVGEDLKPGRLVRVLPTLEPEALGIQAIILSRQYQPLVLRLLVNFFAQRFGGDLPPLKPLRRPLAHDRGRLRYLRPA